MAEEIAAIGIDPTAAIDGAKKVDDAFKRIETAASRLARTVTTKFDRLSQATNALNRITGPSQAAVNRIEGLATALSNFRGLSAVQVRNLNALGRSLDRMSGTRINASLVRTLAFLSNYNGPTARSGANAARLFTAISNFTPPRGLAETTRNLERMANAANRAAVAISQLGTRFNGLTSGGQVVYRQTNRLGQNFEQLGRRAGFLENALLRTQYAMNAIGGILAFRAIQRTAAELQGLEAAFTGIAGTSARARVHLEWVRGLSERLSIDFLTAARNFSLFAASTRGTNFSMNDTREIFENISVATRVLNLDVQGTERTFRALYQIISKGQLQSEELRQQLGDSLPGAFNRMAQALNLTMPQLEDAMRRGQISGERLREGLLTFSRNLARDMRPGLNAATNTINAALARLTNAWTFAIRDLGRGGLNQLIINVANSLTALLNSRSLTTFLSALAYAFRLVSENIEVLAAVMAGLAVRAFAQWITSARLGLIGARGLTGAFGGLLVMSRGLWSGLVGLDAALTGLAIRSLPLASRSMAATTASMGLMASAAIRLRAAQVGIAAGFVSLARNIPSLLGLLATAALLFATMGENVEENSGAQQQLNELIAEADVVYDQMVVAVRLATAEMDNNTRAIRDNIAASLELLRTNFLLGDDSGERSGWLPAVDRAVEEYGGVAIGNDARRQQSMRAIFSDPATGTSYRVVEQMRRQMQDLIRRGNYTPQQYAQNAQAYADSVEMLVQNAQRITDERARARALQGIGTGQDNRGVLNIRGDVNDVLTYGVGIGAIARPNMNLDGTPSNAADGSGGGRGGRGRQRQNIDIQRFTDRISDLRLAEEELRRLQAVEANRQDTDSLFMGARSREIELEASAMREAGEMYKDWQDLLDDQPANLQAEAVRELTRAFQEQGIVTDDIRTGFQRLAELQQEADNRAEVTRMVGERRIENDLLREQLRYVGQGPRATAEWAIQQELLTAAWERGLDINDIAIQQLGVQLRIRRDLNREIAYMQQLEQGVQGIQAAALEAQIYSQGGSQRDVEDRIRLLQRELELRQDANAYTDEQITDMLRVEAGLIRYQRALQDVREEYEAQVRFGDELATSIVDAFKRGAEQGQSFIRTLRDVFKAMEQTVMEFYVWEPLRQAIRDSLNRSANGGPTRQLGDPRELISAQAEVATTMQGASERLNVMAGQVTRAAERLETGLATPQMNVTAATVIVSTPSADNIPSGSPLTPGGGTPSQKNMAKFMQGSAQTGPDPVVTARAQPPAGAGAIIGRAGLDAMRDAVFDGTRTGTIAANSGTQSPFRRILSLLGFSREGRENARGNIQRLFGDRVANTLFGSGQSQRGPLSGINRFFSANGTGGKIFAKVGAAMDTGMAAFGAFTAGKGIGRALGLGNTGSYALGGAAAGMQLGGPIGAAIGLVAGGILGHLKKQPSSFANVVVDAQGRVVVGSSGKRGKGNKANAEALAQGGISIFRDFAELASGVLLPGTKLGTFGQYKDQNFYARPGTRIKKGKPRGTAGVDYIYGTEDQLQIFALKDTIRSGAYDGISENYKKAALNSTATSLGEFNNDISFVKTYEDLIISAERLPDAFTQIRDLLKTYDQAIVKARQLGLAEDKLSEARKKALAKIREDFDYDISQQILKIEDPFQAQFNELKKEYEEAVRTAALVGGDILAVEKLYNLKRKEIIEEMADSALNGLRKQAEQLLHELTATTSSPLSALITQRNAMAEFDSMRSKILAGEDYDKLTLDKVVNDLLETSRSVYASSADFFSIFYDVTEFLKKISSEEFYKPGQPGAQTPIPELDTPAAVLDATPIVQATNLVGEEIVRGNVAQEALLSGILEALNVLVGAGTSSPTNTGATLPGVGTDATIRSGAGVGGGGSGGNNNGGYGGISNVNAL